MKLHFTSGYHPEGNGQTKHTNQNLEQYLHIYCNYQHSNWSDLLLPMEFAYNNAPNTPTNVSPFFANKGYNPNLSIHPEWDLDELHQQLQLMIFNAQKQYQVSANKHQSLAPDFKIGNQVFVNAKHF